MPDIKDSGPILANPPAVPSPKEDALQQIRTREASLGEGIDAVAQQFPGAWLGRLIGQKSIPSDQNWQLTRSKLDELTDGLDQSYWKKFMTVQSESEAQTVRANLLEDQSRKQALASMGGKGTALSMAGQLLDPSNLLISMLTAGAGGIATTGSRVANMARLGLIEASAFGAKEQFVASQDPTKSEWDVAGAAAAGFSAGATTGFIKPGTSLLKRVAAGVGIAASVNAPIEGLRQVMDDDRTSRDFVSSVGLASLFGGVQGAMTHGAQFKSAVTGEVFDTADTVLNTAPERVKVKGSADSLSPTIVDINIDGLWTPEAQARWKAGMGPDASTPPDVRMAKTIAQWMPDAEGAQFVVDAEAPHGEPSATVLHQVNLAEAAKSETTTDAEALDLRYLRARKILNNSDATPDERSFAERTILDVADQRKTNAEAMAAAEATPKPILAMGAASPATIQQTAVPKNPLHGTVPGQWDFSADGVTDAFAWGTEGLRLGKFHLGTSRFGMGGMVGQSPLSEFRFLGNALAPDFIAKSWTKPKGWGSLLFNGSKNLAPGNLAAPEWIHARNNDFYAKIEQSVVPAFSKYKENGGQFEYDDFSKAATNVLRTQQSSGVPEIDKIAADAAAGFKEHLEVMQRHDVPGSETIQSRPDFVPRIVDDIAGHAKIREHGRENIQLVVEHAIAAKQPQLDPNAVSFIADRWLNYQFEQDANLSAFERGGGVDFAHEEDLRAALGSFIRKNNVQVGNPNEIEQIVRAVTRDSGEPGFKHLKMRLEMDETTPFPMKNGASLAISDLLENNLEILQHQYASGAFRNSALAEIYRVYNNRFGLAGSPETVTSLEDMKRSLARVAKDFNKLDPRYNYAKDIDKLDTLLKQTAGVMRSSSIGNLISDEAGARRMANNVRNVMAIRTMGHVQSGIQILSHQMYAITENGATATLRSLPEMGAAIEALRKGGAPANDVMRMMQIIGAGNEMVHARAQARASVDMSADPAYAYQAKQRQGDRIGKFLANGSRMAFMASGQTPIVSMLQKINGVAIASKFLASARSGKLPSEARLFALGLNEPMAKRISAVFNDPSIISHDGHIVTGINETNWIAKDPESMSAFYTGTMKELNRQLALSHPQQYAQWMDGPTGIVMAQLRRWAMGSYEARGLAALQQRDLRALSGMLMLTTTSAAMYAAMKYKDSLVQEDPQEYRDKYLTPQKVFLVGASRSSYFGLLPAAADGALGMLGEDPIFSGGRASAVTAGTVFGGSPFADATARVQNLVQALYRTAKAWGGGDEYAFPNKKDLENGAGLIPRVTGASEGLEFLIQHSNFPETGR